jgi:hypothetical protein
MGPARRRGATVTADPVVRSAGTAGSVRLTSPTTSAPSAASFQALSEAAWRVTSVQRVRSSSYRPTSEMSDMAGMRYNSGEHSGRH